jgi:hypothetical protein
MIPTTSTYIADGLEHAPNARYNGAHICDVVWIWIWFGPLILVEGSWLV